MQKMLWHLLQLQRKYLVKTNDTVKPIKSYSPLIAYGVLFLIPTTSIAIFKFLYVVVKDFFLLQFLQAIKLTHRTVVHVDHPLDDKIPFDPSKMDVYLDFINFWIRPLSMLIKRIGVKRAAPYALEWLHAITLAYSQASRMYRHCMSTTNRPDYNETLQFRQVHFLDPHLLCVPSLHISICAMVIVFYRKLFAIEDFTKEEKEAWSKELFDGATEISETVLYVKQHSVNCIAGAYYMVTKLFKDLMSPSDAILFTSCLFSKATDIKDEDKQAIHKHIAFTYERFLLEGAFEDDWYDSILRWINTYEKITD